MIVQKKVDIGRVNDTLDYLTSRFKDRYDIRLKFGTVADVGTGHMGAVHMTDDCIADYVSVSRDRLDASVEDGHAPVKELVRVVYACFHEERHIQQIAEYDQADISDEIRMRAKFSVLDMSIPEYQTVMYFQDPVEIDAELHGMRETVLFFRKHFKRVAVRRELKAILNGRKQWFLDLPVRSVCRTIRNMTLLKKSAGEFPANDQFLYFEVVDDDGNVSPMSPIRQKIEFNPDFKYALGHDFQTVNEQADHLLRFAKPYLPSNAQIEKLLACAGFC